MVMETRSTSGHIRQLRIDEPQVYAGSAPVDDALGLAYRSLNRPGLVHLDGGGDPDPTLDVPRELRAQRGTARYIALGCALDVHGERIERTHTGELELVVRSETRQRKDQLLDLAWKQVHTSDNQHVVGAAAHASHTPHRARGRRQETRAVARAIADHGQRFLGERGEDELALLSVRQHPAALRVDDLGVEMVFPDHRPVLGLDAFTCDA